MFGSIRGSLSFGGGIVQGVFEGRLGVVFQIGVVRGSRSEVAQGSFGRTLFGGRLGVVQGSCGDCLQVVWGCLGFV